MTDEAQRMIKLMDDFIVQLNRLAKEAMMRAKGDDVPPDPFAVAISFDMLTHVVSLTKHFNMPPTALPMLVDMARRRSAIDILRDEGKLTEAKHQEILQDILKPLGLGQNVEK